MAASNIGNINVNLTATIGNFAQGLQDAAMAAEKQSEKIKSEFNSLGTAIQAAARQAEASKAKFQMGNVFGGLAAAAKEAQKQADIINKEINTIDTRQLDSSFDKLSKAHAKRMAEIKAMPSALDKLKNKMHEVWGRGSRVFISGINKIRAASTSLLNTFGNLTRSVIRYGKWLVLAAAYGLKRLVQSSIQSITTLKNLGGMLGIATDKLQGLQYAAQQADIPAEKMNKALEKMTRRTSEAAHGLGEAQGSLKELGLSAKELNKLTPDEAFLRIAGAMSKVQNQADKTRLATKIFDDEQTVLLNLIDKGEPAIRGYVEQFTKMGIALNSVDVAKVTQAGTAIANIKTVLGGLVDRLTVALAPAITDISNRLMGWLDSGKGIEFVNATIEKTIRIVKYLGDWFQGIGTYINTQIEIAKVLFQGLLETIFGTGVSVEQFGAKASDALGVTEGNVTSLAERFLNLQSVVLKLVGYLTNAFLAPYNAIKAVFFGLVVVITEAMQMAIDGIVSGLNFLIDKIKPFAAKINVEVERISGDSVKDIFETAEKSARENVTEAMNYFENLANNEATNPMEKAFRKASDIASKASDKIAEQVPFSQKLTQWWATANDKAEETAKAQEKITGELSDQMDLEKSNADASFKITKGGRFALNQTPGAGGDSGDKMLGSKLDEQTGILKQLVRKDTAPVLG